MVKRLSICMGYNAFLSFEKKSATWTVIFSLRFFLLFTPINPVLSCVYSPKRAFCVETKVVQNPFAMYFAYFVPNDFIASVKHFYE